MNIHYPIVDLIVVGAGPAGLSCAVEATKAGLSTLLFDKGSIVDSIRRFPTNMVWFSTPELLEIGNIPFVIPTVRPTRVDTLNYYQRVAARFQLAVRQFEGVTGIERREGMLIVRTNRGRIYQAHNVVVATGYFDCPNRLGVQGEELPSVRHYYTEPFEYCGADVAVVGGRNSAVETALDLWRHGARVTLIHRGETLSEGVKYWIRPDIDNRIKRGEVAALFRSSVERICEGSILVRTPDGMKDLKNDFTFVLIGFHPDAGRLAEYGVWVNPETLAPEFDERTFETNVPGLYVAGSVVAGKDNNKVFVENGRLHGAVIVNAIIERRRIIS